MRIGIDLGGTKIAAVILDRDGAERARCRRPTPRGYEQTLAALAAVVAELESVAGAGGSVGLGLPGLVDPAAGTVQAVNLPWLNGRPLAADLRARLGRPVPLANDADCFALSEATDGAAAGAGLVLGLVLGTGVGGALVAGGRLVRGAHGLTGEIGHLPLPWPEPGDPPPVQCGCGHWGCIETILSGQGLVRLFGAAGGQAANGAEVVARAGAGDLSARAALDRYFSALARTLGLVINLIDPEVIVLGGGVSEIPALLETVPDRWGRYALVAHPRTRLVRPLHGAESGMRGAALLGQKPPETGVTG
jgi:fructokinase